MAKDDTVIQKAKDNIVIASLSRKSLNKLRQTIALEFLKKKMQIHAMTVDELESLFCWLTAVLDQDLENL